MKTCPHCGKELPDTARFCMECGAPQESAPGPTVQAQVTGPGAIAQGPGAVAAGERGVAVGILHGNIYTGPPTTDPAEALRIYRQVLAATVGNLPLRGVDLRASDPCSGQKPLSLAQVYVQLDTRSDIPDETLEKILRGEPVDLAMYGIEGRPEIVSLWPRADRGMFELLRPLPALIAAVLNRRLVLLGDPGSGKSTFLNHLALCLAMAALEPAGDWQKRLPGWPSGEMDAVPVLLLLRDFARVTAGETGPAEPRHLWNFIRQRLEAQNLAFAADPLHDVLEKGRAVLLLDGLDEVPTREQRAFVRDAVVAFVHRYPRNRFIVTCRTLSYQDPAGQLADFPAFALARFDEEKIDAFIGAWYAELARLGTVRADDAKGLARQLREAVRRPDLWRLAPNPLLLTVMALVHTHEGRLPDARALLYEKTVDILLWQWEQVKAGGDERAPRLRQLLLEANRTDVDLKRVLWQLAFEAHREGGAAGEGEGLADIGELPLQKALARLHPQESRDWAQQVIEAMKLRAGLLLERAPSVFTFPHRTFQEYLAGAHLSTQADFARQAARLVEEDPFWREVILLAVGRLVYLSGDTDKPLALVGELCPEREVDEEVAWRKAWLAGEALVEAGPERMRGSQLGQDLVNRVRHRLARLLQLGRLRPVERAAAGHTLARLGDPRPGVGVNRETGLPDIVWCYVPPGPFIMGDGDERHKNHSLDYGYLISRYPITNAQFAAFVEAGGYREPRYWREAEQAGVWANGKIKAWPEDEPSEGPYNYGEPFNLPNHPVVGITWYEALAFCRWLEEQVKAGRSPFRVWRDGQLETLNLKPETITLPSEAEWEKAARGPLTSLPEARQEAGRVGGEGPARLYPWGDDPDPERANYGDTGIGTTSAVGCFPGGASPYEVEDLSGNVWEWTRSLWGKRLEKLDFGYPYNPKDGRENLEAGPEVFRVLRGGSFVYGARDFRCAGRVRYLPYLRDRSLGFRVVASPVSCL